MALINTAHFLPEVFRSDTNQKFLGATLDQLTTDAINIPVNGYIGRKFAPTYKLGDNYVPESTATRTQYQLEPSVVIKDDSKNILLNSGYQDLLHRIASYGGLTNNHQRLFGSDSYSYSGQFNFDKFINYHDYYWVPGGPTSVEISTSGTPLSADYVVTRNTSVNGFTFDRLGGQPNTQLTLARGGTYTFTVNQPGFNFWIQSEPGTSGIDPNISTVSTRQVFGVSNNGAETGVIKFHVPLSSAQDFYLSMPTPATVDAAVTFNYTDIQNKFLSSFLEEFTDGLDGITNLLQNKKLVFVGNQIDDTFWTTPALPAGFTGTNTANILPGEIISGTDRISAWQINLVSSGSDFLIQVRPVTSVTPLQKVFVSSGKTYASRQFWLNKNYSFIEVPPITAPNDYLYYQDSSNPNFTGQIKIVDIVATPININKDIVGQKNYTSPEGVIFINGLKVKFNDLVVPLPYANNEYYVEGVGTSISLVPVAQLVPPASIATKLTTTPDYITINRSSQDRNPWSCSNNWFNIRVLEATASYNNTTIDYGPNLPGRRPIIEFDPNLQLFNYGKLAKTSVDLIVLDSSNAFLEIEGKTSYTLTGVPLTPGMRIIFTNDYDISVQNQIYQVDIEIIASQNFIRLIPVDIVLAGEHVSISQGLYQGYTYRFDGTSWFECQSKTALNQTPMFDLVDSNGYSFADTTVYPNSTFATTKNNIGNTVGGTKLFGYSVSTTGANDLILGFPLIYKNFNNIGDIEFTSYYDTDTFTNLNASNVKCNSGYTVINSGIDTSVKHNNWITNEEPTEQYQLITKFNDNKLITFTTSTTAVYPIGTRIPAGNYVFVQIDVAPDPSANIAHLKVFLNNELLDPYTDYWLTSYGVYSVILFNTALSIVEGDKLDVQVLSKNISAFGYYEVPKNLDFNPLNQNFESITLGQLRTHYNKLIENTSFSSSAIVANQDRYLKTHSGTILQHSSPLIYAMAFLTDDTANFVNAINLAKKEYQRFKNRFLSATTTLKTLNYSDVVGSVNTILQSINAVKNDSFPWYYSDMVPYGGNYVDLTYTILNARQINYEISGIFNINALSNRAFLVYLNNKQLTLDIDYRFNTSTPSVAILKSMAVGDTLLIREYTDTDGNYIPETPAKLGLSGGPVAPAIYIDHTYQTPTKVIRGHDGSITPAFNDFRDNFLLELELRIYNNIKTNTFMNQLDTHSTIPGNFRNTAYSLKEWNYLITQDFLEWAGTNSIDYTNNTWFDANNPWTWNYSNFTSIFNNQPLQGSWRAIYDYYFDTETPNTTPWLMLGIDNKPSWWETRYGPAPYTKENIVLWEDLEAGYIWNNNNSYYDDRFVRPGLNKIIPVDSAGNLLPPTQIGIILHSSMATISSNFQIGQHGPAETAWRRSSNYQFALQAAMALARPAQYFSEQIDTSRFSTSSITGQFSNKDNQRISNTLLAVNGDTTTILGTTLRSSGYLNWIVDYIKNLGIDPVAKLNGYFKNLNVQLSYKMSGFTDQNLITVKAEQSSPGSTNASVIIPNESYNAHISKSVPLATIRYSAVVVTKTNSGYSLSGYDSRNPYFTIIPSVANNNVSTMSVGEIGVKLYETSAKETLTVPYGTILSTIQQVSDFLISYERYLVAQGFRFVKFDTDLQQNRDWKLSIKEFLTWVQQGWGDNSVLVLNPIFDTLYVHTYGTVVDEITNLPLRGRLLDSNFAPIKNNLFNIVRSDSPVTTIANNFQISTVDGLTGIAFAELNLVSYETTLIFDNEDTFGDILYIPSQGTRQYRLQLTGAKTGGWDGALSPAGYIYSNPKFNNWQSGVDYHRGDIVVYNGLYYTATTNITAAQTFNLTYWTQISTTSLQTGLLPSFGHNAQIFENIYNLDNPPQDKNYQLFSAGLLGFRERPFLGNLGLDIPTQTKFYQGYIKQKGTINSINALTKGTFEAVNSEIELYEEWAFLAGQYGDVNSNQYKEFILDQSVFLNNPVALTLSTTYNAANIIVNLAVTGNTVTSNVYNASNLSSTSTEIFSNRVNNFTLTDLPTSGYVNLNDIDVQIFDITKVNKIAGVGAGSKIWTAKDESGNWNVYRVNETNTNAISLNYTLDNYAQLSFNNHHGLIQGNYIILENFSDNFNGLYRVVSVQNDLTVTIQIDNIGSLVKKNSVITGNGILYRLQSMILNTIDQIESFRPPHDWDNHDHVWVNQASQTGWGVYTFVAPWLANVATKVTADTITANSQFGYSTAISSNEQYIYIGNPGDTSVKIISTSSSAYSVIDRTEAGFGSVVKTQGNLVVVGAPTAGNVYVYYNNNGTHSLIQTITKSNQFGSSITLSQTGNWLYISEPGDSKVYAYWTANVDSSANFTQVTSVTGTSSTNYGQTIKTNSTGNILLVGAPGSTNVNTQVGNVYVYTMSANALTNSQTLSAQFKNQGANFGYSLDIDSAGGNLFVGAPYSTVSGYMNGVVERWVNTSGVYAFNQTLAHPDNSVGAFGTSVNVSNDSVNLAIGSNGSSTDELTVFDKSSTIIDMGTTTFIDKIINSGAVYLFEPLYNYTTVNPIGQYSYTQQLSEQISPQDQFGFSISTTRDTIVVGAIGTNNKSGVAYVYTNPTKATAWNISTQQQPRVDINSVNRIFIYNKSNNIILGILDFIDPNKGKVLTAVGNDIDFQTTIDPALYNAGTGTTSQDYHWGPAQVGQIWWNLDKVRYVDYEQDALIYRLNHWGETFPGSKISVSEWVESPVPPSQYVATVGDGVPVYLNDRAYSTYGYVDQTGTVKLKYYFWVENKATINVDSGKSNSAISIAAAIENPFAQGIPYATILRDDTLALYNINGLLTGNNSVLHIGSQQANSGLIHAEYKLLQEGNEQSNIPTEIENKLLDSLAGEDSAGNLVPDPTLPASLAYGIKIRPRQSMFINRELALNNYLTLVNGKLSSYPIIENKLLTTLNSSEEIPSVSVAGYVAIVNTVDELSYLEINSVDDGDTGVVGQDFDVNIGDTILVLNDSTNAGRWAVYQLNSAYQYIIATKPDGTPYIQKYKTNNYWKTIDWYVTGYDYTVAPDITVANRLEYGKLTHVAGTYIKVLNNGNSQFEIYYIDSNLNQNLVGIQNGTIQILTDVIIPSKELRQIIFAIQNEIFIDDLANTYNKLFFSMVKYALTEQKNLDWIFKTSFISATQYIRRLQKFPSYIPDNQNYYTDYINEVKPYRTTVREFIVDYQGNDQFGGDITDFDLPPYWDPILHVYRSPNGEQVYDANLLSVTGSVYSQWESNYKYKVIDATIENSGKNYLYAPQIIISGGGGTGATAYATINGNGGVASIIITNPGSGYTTTPNIIIIGTGSGASAYAKLKNQFDNNNQGHNVVRSINTSIKFDRISYTNSNVFVSWSNITSANVGQTIPATTILNLNNTLYSLNNNYIINAAVDFPISNVTPLSMGQFNSANDRIVASVGNIDLALTQLGISYPGVIVEGNTFVGNTYTSIINSFYGNVLGISPGEIIVDGGKYVSTFSSHAPEELVPGRMFDSVNFTVYDTDHLSFRLFDNMYGNSTSYRIASSNITALSSNLGLTDTSILVNDASALTLPSPALNTPGVIFINGEKIIYWRNYALETKTAWAANLQIKSSSLVTYSGNLYLTTGNIYDTNGTFANISSNTQQVTANTLAQIRRGADGTGTPLLQATGSRVVDSSLKQMVPNSYRYPETVSTSTVYQTADTSTVSYALSTNKPITSNINDIITQQINVNDWEPNTVYSPGTYVYYSGYSYTTIGNVFSATFANISSNINPVWTANTIVSSQLMYYNGSTYQVTGNVYSPTFANISTSNPVWTANTAYTYGFVYYSGNTYRIKSNAYGSSFLTVVSNGNVELAFSGNTAVSLAYAGNIGVNQEFTGNVKITGQVKVLENVTNSTFLPIVIVNGTLTGLPESFDGIFAFDMSTFDNVGSILYINGIPTNNIYANTIQKIGVIGTTGTVTVPAHTTVEHNQLWYSPGPGTITNGLPLINSTTPQATFLKASPGITPPPGTTP